MSLDSSFCREEPGERESIRLELVGLAAEIATLSDRIEEELNAVDAPEAAQLTAARQLLAQRAFSVLDPGTVFETVATESLLSAVCDLEGERARMLQLRGEVSDLLQRTRAAACDLDL